MKGKAVRENTELAFDVYCEQGGNVPRTLIELERRGLHLARSTFYDWMKEYRFEERRIEVEEKRQRLGDGNLSHEEQLMLKLEAQVEQYEKYFQTLQKPDNNATFAYTGLLKTISEIKVKTGAFKASLFVDFMKDLINYLSKNDPEAVGVIEKNFDEFITFAREKYASG